MIRRSYFAVLVFGILELYACMAVPESVCAEVNIIASTLFILFFEIVEFRSPQKSIVLLFFNLTYFLFVLSGAFTAVLFGSSVEKYLAASQGAGSVRLACQIANVSIVIVDCVSCCLSKSSSVKHDPIDRTGAVPNTLQKQSMALIFIVTALCKSAMALETMLYSLAHGYISLYVRETSRLPSYITLVGALFYFSFVLFLNTNVHKRLKMFAVVWVCAIELVILMSGDRGEAVCAVLMIIIYYVQSSQQDVRLAQKIKRWTPVAVLAVPLSIYILQMVKYVRLGDEIDLTFGDGIQEFFANQGVSLSIVQWGVDLKDRITETAGGFFLLKQFAGYLRNNVFCRAVFSFSLIRGNTVEMATSGYSYGSTMSFLRFRNSYLNGIGCGTCYLAELYQDGAWFGIIIGSAVLAFFLRKLGNTTSIGWIKNAIYLNIIRIVLVLPRGACFKWFTEAFSIPNLMLLALIAILGLRSKNVKKVTL